MSTLDLCIVTPRGLCKPRLRRHTPTHPARTQTSGDVSTRCNASRHTGMQTQQQQFACGTRQVPTNGPCRANSSCCAMTYVYADPQSFIVKIQLKIVGLYASIYGRFYIPSHDVVISNEMTMTMMIREKLTYSAGRGRCRWRESKVIDDRRPFIHPELIKVNHHRYSAPQPNNNCNCNVFTFSHTQTHNKSQMQKTFLHFLFLSHFIH